MELDVRRKNDRDYNGAGYHQYNYIVGRTIAQLVLNAVLLLGLLCP